MSEFTGFCVEGKEDSCKKNRWFQKYPDSRGRGLRSESKKVYRSVYAVMSLLKIGRVICQGHLSIQ